MAMRATAQFRVGLGGADADDSGATDSAEDEHPASAMIAPEATSKPTLRVPSLRTRPG